MIIYGSRMYFRRRVVKGQGLCPYCGRYGAQQSYDGRKWGHIYFVPLLPLGGVMRVMRECKKCGMGRHVKRDDVEELYGRIEAALPACVAAAGGGGGGVGAGEHEFVDPGDPEGVARATGPWVAYAVEELMATGHGEDIPGIIELFEGERATYEAAVARSADAAQRGELDEAVDAMGRAGAAAPGEAYPHVRLADFAKARGDHEAQLDHLRRASALAGDGDVVLRLEQAEPLEALGRYDELVDLLDDSIERVPQLADDKKFMKLRKKYAKKAGR